MFVYDLRVHQRCTPPQHFLCFGASCHGRRIGQDRPGRLKLGPSALPRALYRRHRCMLKLDGYFHCSGAPKMALLLNFQYGEWVKVPQTSTICRSLMVINTVLWLSNGSLVAKIWQFQVLVVGYCMYVHVCACICMYSQVCACIRRNMHVYAGIHSYQQVYVGINGNCRYLQVCQYV